jgi:4'-phosphopantetheinyl transferase
MQTFSDDNALGQDEKEVALGLSGLLSCRLQIVPEEVHVWQASLSDWLAEGVRHVLSPDEITRADRFHFDRDRNHFIAARGLLRTLLSAYLGINSDELMFSYSDKGKPSLNDAQRNAINFNLAHSHGRVIYAFAHSREVGVDLEQIKEDLQGEQIAERFFSPREIEMLKGVPAKLKKEAFFNCWTRKEAYIKARGEGLLMSLDAFDVTLRPGEPAGLLLNYTEPAEVTRWSMRSLPVSTGYVAALVVEGHNFRLKSFRLE